MQIFIKQAGSLWAVAAFVLGYYQVQPWWAWFLGLVTGAVLIAVAKSLTDTLFHPQRRDQYRARYEADRRGFLTVLARSYLVIIPIALSITTALYVAGWAVKYAGEEFL